MSEHQLCRHTQQVARAFVLIEGIPQIPGVPFEELRKAMRSIPVEERQNVSIELGALALKMQRADPEATLDAVAQLLVLAGELLASLADSAAVFQEQGVEIGEAADQLAIQQSKKPVSGEAAAPNSLFSLRLGRSK